MRSERYKFPNKIDLKPASKRQREYAASLGISLPEDATKSDASALIDRVLDDDLKASCGLMNYSVNQGIDCSPYAGNKYLHNLIFDNLAGAEKITFFCFCVYKFCFKDTNEDLCNHEHKKVFEDFGKLYERNVSFNMSMEEYYGEELITFGKVIKTSEDGRSHIVYGGSIHTPAYKTAYDYLKGHFEI
ncbi:MAG: hypothetical protein K0S71_262 [Clostridia bacterium]|jgi:hypothetical protein|nr:hypothetical protein [Clostridia bacterium]